jgi:hypothetical protein
VVDGTENDELHGEFNVMAKAQKKIKAEKPIFNTSDQYSSTCYGTDHLR